MLVYMPLTILAHPQDGKQTFKSMFFPLPFLLSYYMIFCEQTDKAKHLTTNRHLTYALWVLGNLCPWISRLKTGYRITSSSLVQRKPIGLVEYCSMLIQSCSCNTRLMNLQSLLLGKTVGVLTSFPY